MGKMIGRVLLASALLGAVTFGCHKPMVKQKTPPDPLLVSKKPIEGKPVAGEPALVNRIDPQPPPEPLRREPHVPLNRITRNQP